MSAVSGNSEITGEVLLERTRALGPKLRERVAQTEANRVLPKETIQEMQDAGLFRVVQPKRYGGYELSPQVYFDIEMELARHCPSTAWVYGVVAIHAWQLAVFDERAQEEVWGQDTSVLISSSYMPVGKVEHTEGGFLLSGRWGFSSGSDHCDWAFLGAFVPPKEEGQAPDMRTFLVPRSDYRIDDTWHVSGLRGTGSNDVVIDEPIFVPAYRTHRFSDGFKCDNPGNAVNTSTLYRMPFGQLFNRSVSTSSIGMLEGAIEAFIETQSKRVARGDGRKVSTDPSVLRAISEARATVRDLRCVLASNFRELEAFAAAGEVPPLETRVAFRYDSARVVDRCRAQMVELFAAAGGGAAYESHRLQVFMQALMVARQHHANNPEKPGLNFGGVSIGNKTTDFFL